MKNREQVLFSAYIKDFLLANSSRNLFEYVDGYFNFASKKCNFNEIIKKYNKPTYIYDLSFVASRVGLMKKALGNAKIFYAMKANSNRQVLETILNCGCGVDVVSDGEIHRALEVGFTAKQIVFSGVGKTKREIEFAIRAGIYQINVESLPELLRISSIANSLGVKVDVALRLNPNIDIKTHPYIATGLHENKFGMEMSQLRDIRSILISNSQNVNLVGLSLHLGSQMLEFSGFRDALKILKNIFIELRAEFPGLERFDIGGGLGIIYDKANLEIESEMLNEYSKIVMQELQGLEIEIQTEPGRWLVAHAGVLLSQVQYVKKTRYKTFLVLDTGMNHLIRPALYQAFHEIIPVLEKPTEVRVKYDIVGPICESADFFAKDRLLPEMFQDDFVVILDAGAYGFSMANSYNLQDMADEICI
jgi:diaminopimelate decarboxylase